MGFHPKQYQTKPEYFEAVQLSADNLDHAAKWSGGVVDLDPAGYSSIRVPTIGGVIVVQIGEYIVRDMKTGQFHGKTHQQIVEFYSQVGVRNDTLSERITERTQIENYLSHGEEPINPQH